MVRIAHPQKTNGSDRACWDSATPEGWCAVLRVQIKPSLASSGLPTRSASSAGEKSRQCLNDADPTLFSQRRLIGKGWIARLGAISWKRGTCGTGDDRSYFAPRCWPEVTIGVSDIRPWMMGRWKEPRRGFATAVSHPSPPLFAYWLYQGALWPIP